MVETKGLPLEPTLDALRQAELVPDWIGFWEQALEHGWKPKSTYLRLETAISETYGAEYLQQWKPRMQAFILKNSSPLA